MSTGSQANTASCPSSSRSQQPSLTGTVAELSSPKPHRVQNALILIRTRFLKEKEGIARLRQRGGLPKLLQILMSTNEKLVDITLSILGNCCMESNTRQEILELEGIDKIAKLLEKSTLESIRNRVCRTLANLALDPECCSLMHEMEELEVVKNVVKLLKDSTDAECQQTYLRTLRLLADNKIHERMVLEEGALRAAALLLKSEDSTVIMASLKTVNHFTKQITEEHCLQLVGGDGPATLISLVSNPDENISGSARSLILTFIKCELLRPPFGAAGIIPFFLQNVEESTVNSQQFSYVNALCLCCRESVNRVRIRESGALVLLVDWLNNCTFAPIHYRIISSLVCFLYDEVGMELLLKNSIVPTLVKHLKRCAKILDCAMGSCVKETEVISCSMEDVDVEAIEECQKDLEPVIVLPASTDPLQLESDGQGLGEGSGEAVQQDPLGEEEEKMEKKKDEKKEKEVNEEEDKTQAASSVQQASEKYETAEEADASVNKRSATKYSIDSPTYKEMTENRNDDDSYYTGPRNIMESAQYYGGGPSSPEKMSPYRSPHHGGSYSPLSVSSYLASDWSPEVSPSSSPTRSQSPVISFCSQDSTGSQGPFSNSGAPSVTLPLWSSTQGSSPSASQQSNLSYISPMSSPPHPQASPPIFRSSSSPSFWSPVHSVTHHPQFSSEEDEDNDEADEEGERESQHRNVTFQVGDNAPSLLLDEDLFPAVPVIHSASPQPSTSGKQGNCSGHSAGPATSSVQQKTGRKRRHSLTLEMQRNIRRKVEADSRSSSVVSLESLIADGKSIKFEKTEGELSKIKGPRKITEYNILVLLSRISCMDDPSQYMGNSIPWTALLNYVRFARNPIQRAAKLMIRLTRNPNCFATLVLSMIPELIDRLLCCEFDDTKKELSDEAMKVPVTKPIDNLPEKDQTEEPPGEKHTCYSNTRQLRDQLLGSLSIMAESHYGRGTLTNVLLRKSKLEQLYCAVSLPFICRSVSLREDLLLNCGALAVLLERLLQPGEKEEEREATVTFEMLVHSIRELAHKADLPSFATSSWGSKIAFHSSDPPVTFDLTFMLDDGSQIKGQRQVMVSRSSVFKAMLQGHYSESDQSQIKIPDVSSQAFQIFIDLVHGSSIKVPSFVRENLDTHLEVSLEILGLCNRFLVLELQQKVSEYICDHVMSVACAVDIIEFALVHNSTWLLRQGLCYVLSKSMSFQDAVFCFQELASTHHSAHIIKELKTILS